MAKRPITWCSLVRQSTPRLKPCEVQFDSHELMLLQRGRDQTKYDRERPGLYDALKKRASLIRKTSRSRREDTPSPGPGAALQTPYQHGDAEKRLICDVGQDLCNKARRMGVEGHTTCIVIYRNPVHGEWVSAGHIDQGDVIPSLDSVVSLPTPAPVLLVLKTSIGRRAYGTPTRGQWEVAFHQS